MICRFQLNIFIFSKQLYKTRLYLSVCVSIYVCATAFSAMFLSFDFHETYTKHQVEKSTVTWSVRSPLYRSVPIWPILFIFCTSITQEIMMCHTPFPGQRTEDEGHRGCWNFVMPVPWLCACMTDLFHMWHKYNPGDHNVSHTISLP